MKKMHGILAVRRTVIYLILSLLMIISICPFLILIVNSTRMHAQILTGFSLVPAPYFIMNLRNLLGNPNLPVLRALLNSLLVSFGTAFLATYFSAMTAYGIHMYNFKGNRGAFKFIMAVMMVPAQVTALGFVQLMDRMHLTDTLVPLIVPAIASPVVFFYIYHYMQASLPKSIVEASRVDGCHEFLTFNVIVLPMIKPAIAVQAIFSFVNSWNNYFLPVLILN